MPRIAVAATSPFSLHDAHWPPTKLIVRTRERKIKTERDDTKKERNREMTVRWKKGPLSKKDFTLSFVFFKNSNFVYFWLK